MHEPATETEPKFKLVDPPPGDYERVRLPLRWLPSLDREADPALIVGYEISGYDSGLDDEVMHEIELPTRLTEFMSGRGAALMEHLGGELGLWHAQTAGISCHQKYVMGIRLSMPDRSMVGAMRLSRALLDSCIAAPARLSHLVEYQSLLTQYLGVTIESPRAYQQMEEACYPIDATGENLAQLLEITPEEAEQILTAAVPELPERDEDLSRTEKFDRFMLLSAIMHDRINIWIFGENCD